MFSHHNRGYGGGRGCGCGCPYCQSGNETLHPYDQVRFGGSRGCLHCGRRLSDEDYTAKSLRRTAKAGGYSAKTSGTSRSKKVKID